MYPAKWTSTEMGHLGIACLVGMLKRYTELANIGTSPELWDSPHKLVNNSVREVACISYTRVREIILEN